MLKTKNLFYLGVERECLSGDLLVVIILVLSRNYSSSSLIVEDIADHPWIREDGEAPDKPLDNTVISRMKQFRAMNKLKKVALKVIKCFSFVYHLK